jgi:hypothetical protein
MTSMQCQRCEGSGVYRASFGDGEAIYTCEDCLEGLAKCFPSIKRQDWCLFEKLEVLIVKTYHDGFVAGRKSVNDQSSGGQP